MNSKLKLSDEISSILTFFKSVKVEYENSRTELSVCDRKTSDFNHALELNKLNYKERAKLATEQQKNLIERREHKDILYKYKPIIELLETKEGQRFINLLSETLGKVRKQEKSLENRTYHKRIKNNE